VARVSRLMGAYLTYLELSTGKDKQIIEFQIDVRCKCSLIPQMTSSQCGKENSIFTKKKVLFSTSQIPLAVGASCVICSATRVRVEGVGSPRVAEKKSTKATKKSRKWF
jgi:hypothetical protein